MTELDLKDRKILYELDKNCRQSNSQIAKKVRLSKNAVRYRIDRMIQKGIIKKFHTLINIGKLGYTGFRIYVNLKNTTSKIEEEIIQFLRNRSEVVWIASLEGEYNLGMLIVAKNIREIDNVWNHLIENYINYFYERALSIVVKSSYFSMGYIIDKERSDYKITTTTLPDDSIDKIDKHIVQMLAENANISIVEIANHLDYSSKTIIERIKRLEKKGVIVAYKAFIDYEKLDYQHYKISFILSKVSKEKEMIFREFTKQHPNIVNYEKHIGGGDVEIDIHVKNHSHLRRILSEIRDKFSDILYDHTILQVYEEHKNTYFISDEHKLRDKKNSVDKKK
jgi:DNA-binding Lrp family transcriptional regulator